MGCGRSFFDRLTPPKMIVVLASRYAVLHTIGVRIFVVFSADEISKAWCDFLPDFAWSLGSDDASAIFGHGSH